MVHEPWPEIERCFHELADLPPAEQRRVLEQRYGDRPDLRRRLEVLLALDRDSTPFMERPVLSARGVLAEEDAGIDNLSGRVVGRYRLLRPIAYGGMGTVYLARREDGRLDGQVAVKFLRAGIDSRRLMRRYRVERRALAHLNHPNIARLLDAGTTGAVGPYLVMEYVDGLPVGEYCDRHRLSIKERLELFRAVCLAVHAAHRSLVVHRDLKPDNILVTPDGLPKLVDFGIARLSSPGGGPSGGQTTGSRLMTPEYASPEQVRGEPVTTATDIYSLGVVLYGLLTGDRPYRVDRGGPGEVERVVCELVPPRPSTVVAQPGMGRGEAAGNRRVSPEGLRRRLRGDLDNVVMMALRKEPHRRYASAAEFAEDVRRYLAGLPVMARQDTMWYRTRKFILRNKLAASAAAVLVLCLAAGTVAIGWQAYLAAQQRDAAELARTNERLQRQRAETAEREARAEAARAADEAESARLVGEFLVEVFKVADPAAPAETVTARQILDEAAARLRREPDLKPAARASLAHAVGRVSLNLGLYERANELLDQALEIRRNTFGDDGEPTLETRAVLGQLLYARGEYVRAREVFQNLLDVRRRRGESESLQLAAALNDLAATRKALGELEGVEPLYREALEIRQRQLGENDPAVAETLNNLAGLHAARGDLAEARRRLNEALGVRRAALGDAHPLTAQTISNLAVVAQMRGDIAAAEPLFREALDLFREIYGDEHPAVATTASGLGTLLRERGELSESEQYLREALALRRRQLGDGHHMVARSLVALAKTLRDRGDRPAARDAAEESVRICRAALPPSHPDTASALQVHGAVLLDLGEHKAAEEALREALGIFREALPAGHPYTAMTEHRLAAVLVARGSLDEAEPLLLRAYEVFSSDRGKQDPSARQVATELAGLCERLGRRQDAELWRGRAGAP